MIKKVAMMLVAFSFWGTAPSHAFLDYLFSGSASRDAIDNSAVGDIRAWWSGNPVYNFNPYYSGAASMNQQQQQGQQQQPSMQPQASINYVPGGQGGYDTSQQPGSYGYQGYAPGAVQQQQPMYGAAQPPVQPQPQYYPQQPQGQPMYQPPQQQYAPMGQAPQGYPPPGGSYQ